MKHANKPSFWRYIITPRNNVFSIEKNIIITCKDGKKYSFNNKRTKRIRIIIYIIQLLLLFTTPIMIGLLKIYNKMTIYNVLICVAVFLIVLLLSSYIEYLLIQFIPLNNQVQKDPYRSKQNGKT